MSEPNNEIRPLLQRARQAQSSGNSIAALALLYRALTIKPSEDEAAHYVGVHLSEGGTHDLAVRWIARSIVLQQSNPLYWLNQAIALQKIKDFDRALQSLKRSSSIDDISWKTYLNFGHVYRETKHRAEAVHAYEKSLCINPGYSPTYEHLSFVYDHVLLLEKRVRSLELAKILTPDNIDVCFSLGLYSLMMGRFAEGWDLLEYRWVASHAADNPNYSKRLITSRPAFTGEESHGRIFIWSEQGIGDEIMFCSTLADFLRKYPLRVILQVDERLAPLIERSFPKVQVVRRGTILDEDLYDCHLPFGSLPRLLRRSEGSFESGRSPFLKASPDRVRLFRDRLSAGGRPIVGLSWWSSNGALRCIPLRDLITSLDGTNVTLVNLQYGNHSKEIEDVSQALSRQVFDFDEVDCLEDMEGLAALLECCDLVVSVANTTVHLAGALGRPTIALLPYFPGWRWLNNGNRCLWYDSVCLLRQDVLGDWGNVLGQIATAIDRLCEGRGAGSVLRELD